MLFNRRSASRRALVPCCLLGSLKDLAYLVWESDYASLFELEQLALEESGRLMTAAALLKAVPEKSTYAQKGRSKIDKTKDDALRAMHLAVMAMRQANQLPLRTPNHGGASMRGPGTRR